MADVLLIKSLSVVNSRTGEPLISDVSLHIGSGELVGLVGESGSGKTTVGLSCLGFFRSGSRYASGSIHLAGEALPLHQPAALRLLRRQRVAYVPQSASNSMNPARTIGAQLRERFAAGSEAVEERLIELFEQVALPRDKQLLSRYPHQFSGGQLQRVAVAAALIANPELIIFDEPTTGLDVLVQAQLMDTLKGVCRARHIAALFISHDLATVAEFCGRTMVMKGGRVVEIGSTAQVLGQPRSDYGKQLISAVPSLAGAMAELQPTVIEEGAATLELKGINAFHGSQQILHDINLRIPTGQCTALVGESGSGKTTLCRLLIGLHRSYNGEVLFEGQSLAPIANERTAAQRQTMQYVFQSPYDALNPRATVAENMLLPLRFFGLTIAPNTVRDLLAKVCLSAAHGQRYPHHLSGGERQRVALARALAMRPRLMICDEVTSALDVSVQASVVKLISELRQEMELTVIFVTHQLALVPGLAQHVAVLRDGRLLESGPVAQVLTKPKVDFTRALLHHTPDLGRALATQGALPC